MLGLETLTGTAVGTLDGAHEGTPGIGRGPLLRFKTRTGAIDGRVVELDAASLGMMPEGFACVSGSTGG